MGSKSGGSQMQGAGQLPGQGQVPQGAPQAPMVSGQQMPFQTQQSTYRPNPEALFAYQNALRNQQRPTAPQLPFQSAATLAQQSPFQAAQSTYRPNPEALSAYQNAIRGAQAPMPPQIPFQSATSLAQRSQQAMPITQPSSMGGITGGPAMNNVYGLPPAYPYMQSQLASMLPGLFGPRMFASGGAVKDKSHDHETIELALEIANLISNRRRGDDE